MLPLPSFAYEAPDTLGEAVTLLCEDGARVVAGGTDLLPSMKHRLFEPALLVSLSRIADLRRIEVDDSGLSIGAMATLRQVQRHDEVIERYPALADACRTVATSTIQAMGTLGGNVMLDTRCLYYNQPAGWREAVGGCLKADGNVCHVARSGAGCYAAQSSDTVPVLWLLDARLELASVDFGTRQIALRKVFGTDGRQWLKLANSEILTRIIIPRPGPPIAFRKVRPRGSIDYGSLLVAVQRDSTGATAVVSAVGPRPIEVRTERVADLAEAAWKATRPLNTHAWSTTWRKHMVKVEVQRALDDLRD